MNKSIRWTFFVVTILVLSCKKDKVPEKVEVIDGVCATTVSYNSSIKTLMNQNCNTSGCHNASSKSGGYNLEDYDVVQSNANKILTAIKHEGGSPMPLGQDKLPDSLIQSFECWVAQGTQNN
jgi:hypothetical protein